MEKIFATNEFFDQSDPTALPFHISSFTVSTYQPGDIIVNGNDISCRNLYLVLSGKVRLIYPDSGKKFLTFEDVETGGFFGLEGALVPEGKLYYASAADECMIAVASDEGIKNILSDIRLAKNLIQKLCESSAAVKIYGAVKQNVQNNV
jgi:CRP-like cAMP-binding protein